MCFPYPADLRRLEKMPFEPIRISLKQTTLVLLWALCLMALPALGWAAEEPTGVPIDPVGRTLREIFLGGPEEVLVCPGCPEASPFLIDATTGISTPVSLPYWQVNDLVLSKDRKRILVATSSEQGKESVLLLLSADSLAPLSRIEIPGNGRRAAMSEDGYSAYVIAHRPKPGAPDEEGKWELLAVDLGDGGVTQSYPLASPAAHVTLSPDGGRLFVAQPDKVQSFRSRPLTASWYYRSPGHNRGMAVHPATGHLYVLRGSSVAVFDPAPREPIGEGNGGDDATRVLPIPIRVERLVFSESGMVAVGAGLDLKEMIILDGQEERLVGVWPHDAGAVQPLLNRMAEAENPPGPRGKLVVTNEGLVPPLSLPSAPPPPETEPPSPVSAQPEREESPTTQTPPTPPSAAPPPLSLPKSPQPAEEPSAPAKPDRQESLPDLMIVEEVAAQVLEGKLTGEASLVKEVLLYGPNSLILIQDRVVPGPDGTYSFKLPTPGPYRIVPSGGPKVTLACRPIFRTLRVGDYGFKGLDFHILGAVFGSAVPPEKIVR